MQRSDPVAMRAAELWGHLPADVVPDPKDPLEFRADDAGNIMVDHGGDVFVLREGAGWRWHRREDGRADFHGWRDGKPIGSTVLPAGVGPEDASLA